MMMNQVVNSNMTQTGVESGPNRSNNDSVNSSFQLNENTPGEPMMYYQEIQNQMIIH